MRTQKFNAYRLKLVYLWQGERHTHLKDFTSKAEAIEVLNEFRTAGWRAWLEPIR